MDWNPRTFRPYGNNITMPFFMAYPGYMGAEQERMILQDLEYLQQNYPNEVKRYQSRVAEILDKFDYEGSMIYDEYPDRYSLQRLAGSVIEIMKREDSELPEDRRTSPEKWMWLEDMVLVLLLYEVYKRRHGGRRAFMRF
ncbi:MAG: hypothetical protein IJF07_04530 [Lachnospiraceae bacterium]|nr:hypothetical protein [Lachnospiraceae bacterium]